MRDVEETLAAAGSRIQVAHALPEEREALLERILSEPQSRTRRSVRRRKASRKKVGLTVALAVTGALAATAAVVSDLLPGSYPEPACGATPPMLKISSARDLSAREELEAVARRTERLKEPTSSSDHFVQETWSLSTRIGGRQITSAVVPERRDSWKSADGTIKWSVRAEDPQFQNSKQKEMWQGQWDSIDEPTTRTGKGGSSYGNPPGPDGMRKWLGKGSPGDTAGFISESLVQKLMTNHLSPRQRAAVLRTLAAKKGLRFSGSTTDRAGRDGVAFTVESTNSVVPSKHILIIDPRHGRVLAYEEVLTGDPGRLKVKTPAVVNYVTFLKG
ncbi:CU044_5270 family protein [Streptomyces sp. NPDC056002]|uniref:CU044_5270 family protein n=1 Tax=Streptomyces sp. NPDC056002 TaxID=3345675 RepID=UPI0035D5E396